jgi:biotin carboxyl carrier protein
MRARIIVVIASLIAVGLIATLGYLVFGKGGPLANSRADVADIDAAGAQMKAPTETEIRAQEATTAGAAADDPNISYLPTPLIARYGDLVIHTPISANHITEIEFHQASFSTALQLTPLVTIVDAQVVADQSGTRHTPFDEQPRGSESLIAEAVSTWRLDSAGPEMSAADVGALAGTDVYAPISGTVVKIKTYSLFGLIDDYEVHIQSPEYPELDIVMLHIEDLSVEVGDRVYGGATRVAKIRNIGDVIDNNLANFTAPGDPGNHCHVQVNDATREDYRGLEGALDIFNGNGYARPEPPPESE